VRALLLLVACAGPDPGGEAVASPATVTTVTTPTDAPWVLPQEPPAAVDLAAVLAAAQEGLELARVLVPDPVLEAYRDLVVGADAACPAMYEDDGFEYWLDSCTSATGTSFDGYGLDDDLYVDDGYGAYVVSATGGAGVIESPDGTFLELDGFAQLVEAEDAGVLASTIVLVGDFATNHPAAAGTWLEEGLRPGLVTTRYETLGVTLAFAATGAIDGLGGDFPAVAFEEAVLVAALAGGCGLEPSGAISVRLATGDWVDVVFDPTFVDDVPVFDAASCDGCGEAWHRDVPLGEACLDFSTW
jgi:hypothetical protein